MAFCTRLLRPYGPKEHTNITYSLGTPIPIKSIRLRLCQPCYLAHKQGPPLIDIWGGSCLRPTTRRHWNSEHLVHNHCLWLTSMPTNNYAFSSSSSSFFFETFFFFFLLKKRRGLFFILLREKWVGLVDGGAYWLPFSSLEKVPP